MKWHSTITTTTSTVPVPIDDRAVGGSSSSIISPQLIPLSSLLDKNNSSSTSGSGGILRSRVASTTANATKTKIQEEEEQQQQQQQQATITSNTNSNSNNASIHSTVSFGTVMIREYERKLDTYSDCYLGLTIGWEYTELEPTDMHKIAVKEDYGEAELTTEVDRAKILLAAGYTKQGLRSALELQHRGGSKDASSGLARNTQTRNLLDKTFEFKRVLKNPRQMMKRVSGTTKKRLSITKDALLSLFISD
ncbi:hypothetical protein FRACYDRAFT_252155 [Fragilariopsis cylindrus CCMP1102]|uniref:Uncharacterized protein n=1 Tax=Fragilariopsis cylindrus CCMP1102 TaxID=635003 RepID=A0A1E7ENA7_9STRA|nr:hypothetical protein FRACYDRAFT_252155 [Fragilariopsis cylindrus CCMP1102]|eukprot:OEU07053.1 hypothetical protein FRACYDRAFT_252155 [Fragilariopsis cylindrus CCMP1102]